MTATAATTPVTGPTRVLRRLARRELHSPRSTAAPNSSSGTIPYARPRWIAM